jgi:hypothetical protein
MRDARGDVFGVAARLGASPLDDDDDDDDDRTMTVRDAAPR